MERTAGLILAAGVSSRMGKFKPLLYVDGKTMIQRVVEMMQSAGASPVIVVAGYQAELLERHLGGMEVQLVRNPRYYETQMLDSLLLGLGRLSPEVQRVMVSPADIPLVKPETVRALLRADGPFIRPVCGGTPGHPVILSTSILRELKTYTGKDGLNGAVSALNIPITEVEVADRGTALDSDTRDEYAALLKYRRQETNRPQPLQLDLQVCIQAETSFWNPGCAQFLELIQTTGSMLSACQCMHISYSKGWTTINEIERQLGRPVLVRNQGGSNGGGSELTELGRRFLNAYRKMNHEIMSYSQQAFHHYFQEEGAF